MLVVMQTDATQTDIDRVWRDKEMGYLGADARRLQPWARGQRCYVDDSRIRRCRGRAGHSCAAVPGVTVAPEHRADRSRRSNRRPDVVVIAGRARWNRAADRDRRAASEQRSDRASRRCTAAQLSVRIPGRGQAGPGAAAPARREPVCRS
jgi:hypothetical protein